MCKAVTEFQYYWLIPIPYNNITFNDDNYGLRASIHGLNEDEMDKVYKKYGEYYGYSILDLYRLYLPAYEIYVEPNLIEVGNQLSYAYDNEYHDMHEIEYQTFNIQA